jgi:hypothetical protein
MGKKPYPLDVIRMSKSFPALVVVDTINLRSSGRYLPFIVIVEYRYH